MIEAKHPSPPSDPDHRPGGSPKLGRIALSGSAHAALLPPSSRSPETRAFLGDAGRESDEGRSSRLADKLGLPGREQTDKGTRSAERSKRIGVGCCRLPGCSHQRGYLAGRIWL